MNANEREWESLSNLWRDPGQEIGRAALRRLVASHRRRLVAVAAGEASIVAGFIWLSLLFVRDGLVAWEAVWLSTLWIFTAIAAPVSWWNRRGSWHSMTESVAEFRRQRAMRWLRSLLFACWLFVAEVIVAAGELAWFGRFTSLAAGSLAALTVVFVAWALWMRKRIAAEVAQVEIEF